jgi:hypothetical protein
MWQCKNQAPGLSVTVKKLGQERKMRELGKRLTPTDGGISAINWVYVTAERAFTMSDGSM